MLGIWKFNTFFFARLHWISLLYCWGDVSYQEFFLCVVNPSLQIYLSHSNYCWVFYPPCLEGFPRVYLVSHGWLIYMADLYGWFMWLIYLWYSHVVDIFICVWFMKYTCDGSWNWLINVLKFKLILFCSKHQQAYDSHILIARGRS